MTATVITTRVLKGHTLYTVKDGNKQYKTTTKPGEAHVVDWELHATLNRKLKKAKGKEWWVVSDQMLSNLGG